MGANNKWKETLGAWRQYEQSFPLLQQSSIDTVSLECIHSHVPLELIRGMLGAINLATETAKTPEEIANVLRRALDSVNADKLIPSSKWGDGPVGTGPRAESSARDLLERTGSKLTAPTFAPGPVTIRLERNEAVVHAAPTGRATFALTGSSAKG